MTYVKTYLPTLKTHVVNLKRDAKDLPCDLQRLEVRGKLESKTLYSKDPEARSNANQILGSDRNNDEDLSKLADANYFLS